MRFIKLHGYGNDYLVFKDEDLRDVGDLAGFARRVCERHFGAGADGIALVGRTGRHAGSFDDTRSVDTDSSVEADSSADAAGSVDAAGSGVGEAADFRVRIFNPDGSEAAMSGNGTRCAAAALFHDGVWTRPELRLSTRAGIKVYRLLAGGEGSGRFRFSAEIGRPRFESRSVPVLTDEPLPRVVDHPLEVAPGETVRITALEMCNPNCCLFVDDFAAVDWRRLGRLIESHPRFPLRTNVEFIRVLSPERIEVRIWERGAGETLSSGTGSSAAAVASALTGRTNRAVTVETPGGALSVEWREPDGEVLLTGEAEVIYRGEWLKG